MLSLVFVFRQLLLSARWTFTFRVIKVTQYGNYSNNVAEYGTYLSALLNVSGHKYNAGDRKNHSKVEYATENDSSWYSSGRKYFVYQPSGGVSNQLLLLEAALLISHALNRTLVVPPVAPHTSGWWNYNAVHKDKLLSIDHVINAKNLSKISPVRNTFGQKTNNHDVIYNML